MPKQISVSRIILNVLDEVTKLLKDLSINYALLGGLALAVWGRERATKDIDIVISTEDNLEILINLLKKPPFSVRSAFRRLGDSLLIFATCEDKETGFPINIDIFIARTDYQREALNRSLELEILGRKIKVMKAEDIILYKLLSDRPIDFVDAQVLWEENINDIDENYLKDCAKRLGIGSRLKSLFKKKKG